MANELGYLDKSITFIKERFPELAASLPSGQGLHSKVVYADGAPVNIDFDAGTLYAEDMSGYVDKQIETFVERPERIILNGPEGCFLQSGVSIWALKGIQHSIILKQGITEVPLSPSGFVGYLIVLGVGIGDHIEKLVKKFNPRHIVIVEPIPEFYLHSFGIYDWQEMIEGWESLGKTVDFVLGDDPDALCQGIINKVREYGIPLIDGSYLYTHYNSWVNQETRFKFREKIPYEVVSRGFYEDEIIMVENAAGNLIHNDFRFLSSDAKMRREEPAFIVASGPSIDQSIEAIKKYQGKAVVFSSGSSLQILLHHGIIPDYHVELENVPAVVDMLEHILELNVDKFPNGKFEGIQLIGSITVNKDVPPMFDDSYLFFRDSVSSSYIFARGFKHISGVGPNVSNTSLTCAAMLGFHKIYFFGADCGYRHRDYHHSKNTAYYTSKKFGGGSGSTENAVPEKFSYPGNFGGIVHTDLLLDWNRQLLEQILRIFRVTAFNCSDGVKIEGASPLVSRALNLKGPDLDKKKLVEEIRDSLLSVPAGSYFETNAVDEHLRQIKDLRAEYAAFHETQIEERPDFEEFYLRLIHFVEAKDVEYKGVQRMVSGSIYAIPKIALFYLNRIKDEADRDEVYADFLVEFARITEFMFEEIFKQFVRLLTEELKLELSPELLHWEPAADEIIPLTE